MNEYLSKFNHKAEDYSRVGVIIGKTVAIAHASHERDVSLLSWLHSVPVSVSLQTYSRVALSDYYIL